jgi:TatA/E family protein of Tat protein translocase
MFGSIGIYELLIIFTIALLVFGPRKLPELGKSLGKTLQEFRRATNELQHTLNEEVALEEHKKQAAVPAPALPTPAEPSVVSPEVLPAEASETPVTIAEPETVARGQQ